ncbi:transcription initiation factor TFIID subunit 8-like [Amaranthus tricolor]|uniref:transcription initiation factor TFIID subunit 8-like n=1 Tax=Amaranthus tricolor TaxID=29722 RepID=UPI00258E726A|nr:transcription initiation factor TFIID subunit 8-like [Amaranthus tricolor]
MSDGGKEIGNDPVQQQLLPQNTRKPAGSEDFVRAIAKISVAQICENEGFQGFQHSALEALADVAVRYVKQLGKISNHYANQAGRSDSNLFDVIRGLEDLGSIQGFQGASDVHRSLANSGTVREIGQFISIVEGIPFVFSLPRFPVTKERKSPSSFLQIGEDPPDHIPHWLPAFPSSSDEREVNAHDTDTKDEEQKAMNIQKQQQQQHLTNNGTEAVEINPFLAPPLAYGDKPVSLIEPPLPRRRWEGNHVNFMDAFAPVAETVAGNEVSEVEDTNKDIRLVERPTVRLKFGNTKRKSLRVIKNVIAQSNGDDRLAILFEKNDANDEKKTSAEQILKESPLDTTEL